MENEEAEAARFGGVSADEGDETRGGGRSCLACSKESEESAADWGLLCLFLLENERRGRYERCFY